MIIIKCRINGEYMFDLLEWESQAFNANPCLKLETTDLARVKEVFDDYIQFITN